jgi:hypothetical protein
MADLGAALRAAAEEADKVDRENKARFDNIEHWVSYIESEQTKIKAKLKKASETAQLLADILSED